MLGHRHFEIRRLQAPDVHAVLTIISECHRACGWEELVEPSTRNLFEAFRNRRSAFFVATIDGEVVGGAGIARLPDANGSVCELQRMYLRPQSRGRGIGHALLQRCADTARQLRYERCYAEASSEMSAAIAFYERHGFERLTASLSAATLIQNKCCFL
jgi:ribosomal protein S18 acetylase RimI-like enzyme